MTFNKFALGCVDEVFMFRWSSCDMPGCKLSLHRFPVITFRATSSKPDATLSPQTARNCHVFQVEQVQQARPQAAAYKEQLIMTHLYKTVLMGFRDKPPKWQLGVPSRIDI